MRKYSEKCINQRRKNHKTRVSKLFFLQLMHVFTSYFYALTENGCMQGSTPQGQIPRSTSKEEIAPGCNIMNSEESVRIDDDNCGNQVK